MSAKEKQGARLRAELLVECPACGEDFDLFDEDDDMQFLKPIFNNDWGALRGIEIPCPSCGHWIEIEGVTWLAPKNTDTGKSSAVSAAAPTVETNAF